MLKLAEDKTITVEGVVVVQKDADGEALANPVRKSVAHIDGASAKDSTPASPN